MTDDAAGGTEARRDEAVPSRKAPPSPADEAAAEEGLLCSACGADLAFDPTTQSLSCAYCGAQRSLGLAPQGEPPPLPPEEHDLGAILAARGNAPRRPLHARQRRVSCEGCGATVTFQGSVVATHCEFCGSARILVREEATPAELRAESLAPFKINRQEAARRHREWLAGLWFRPTALKRAARLTELAGVYLPFWSFDARVDSQWTAESGTRHRVGWGKRRRTVIRWKPAAGHRSDAFDDLLVPASRGVAKEHAPLVKGFTTSGLVPWDPAYLAGFSAEEPGVPVEAAWKQAEADLLEVVRGNCRSDVPGDTCRNLAVASAVRDQRVKAVLLPVWFAAYEFSGKTWQFLVDGRTGAVRGRAPWSVWKIAALVVGAALTVVVLVSLGR